VKGFDLDAAPEVIVGILGQEVRSAIACGGGVGPAFRGVGKLRDAIIAWGGVTARNLLF